MADLKISALPASTTPLAGTEVVPLVQFGATKKVSVDDLTAGKTVPANAIQFPATQVASANANTLDDYEENTFTPTIIGDSVAGTGTYSSQAGKYTKIGNLVTFSAVVVWSAHTGVGNMRVANLPFTSAAGTPEPPVALLLSEITFTGVPCGIVVAGNNQVYLATMASGVGAAPLPIDTAGAIIVSGSYQV
jgi:hypothetical protein